MKENPPISAADNLPQIFGELGIPADYGRQPLRPAYAQVTELVDIGANLLGRMQRLTPAAAAHWQELATAAASDGIQLLLISGFRSIDYQADLIRNKLAAGQVIDDILAVNAAPGFSQHHTGAAVDIASPGTRPLTEEFETSDAFKWLQSNAESSGFSMTYPRGNAEGFVYEPWHWALGELARGG